MSFSSYVADNALHWHSSHGIPWVSELSVLAKKPLAPTTVQQKITHINFLAAMRPPLLPGGEILLPRYFKGLAKLIPGITAKYSKYLPPWFIVKLYRMEKPELIHLAILVQFYLATRAGHFTMLEPQHFMAGNVMLPPFKFQKRAVLLPLHHLPPGLLEKFLSLCGSQHYAPLLPWLPSTYKKMFKTITLELGLSNASHSARHAFASIQAILGTQLDIIQRYLIHKRTITTEKTYVHSMSAEDIATILANPDIFIPCSPVLAPAALGLLDDSLGMSKSRGKR